MTAVQRAARRARTIATVVRVVEPFAFAALPIAAIVGMYVVALADGPFALDFRNELYPNARSLMQGDNPYPATIWPPFALAIAAVFSGLPSVAAGLAFTLGGIVSMAAALRLARRARSTRAKPFRR